VRPEKALSGMRDALGGDGAEARAKITVGLQSVVTKKAFAGRL